MAKVFIAATPDAMHELGRMIARVFSKGGFIALMGDLGAGKTQLVRGIASYFGQEDILSPTYTIVQEYDAWIPLYHFDVYRLNDPDELYAIGFEDYLQRDGALLMMEWADLVEECLPAERMDITVIGEGDGPRSILLGPHGKRYEDLVWEI